MFEEKSDLVPLATTKPTYSAPGRYVITLGGNFCGHRKQKIAQHGSHPQQFHSAVSVQKIPLQLDWP